MITIEDSDTINADDVRDEYVLKGEGTLWACRSCWAVVSYVDLNRHLDWHARIDGLDGAGTLEP